MVTRWEQLYLLTMTLPIMGHVVLLPLMIDLAGRDIWISILISMPVGIAFAYAIYRLRAAYPGQSGKELLLSVLGKWIGSLMIGLFTAYFLFLTILSFAVLIDLVFIGFFPETPRLALMIWFGIFFIYASLKGVKRIALTAGILTFVGVITGHSVTLMDSNFKDWSQMLPILEHGWSPPLWGALLLVSVWIELLLLLCIPIKDIREKRLFLFWVAGVVLNGITMFSTSSGVITIFGLGQAGNFEYPATEIVRIISLGFIDRFDIYAMILMLFGVYIRCSLYLRIAYELSFKAQAPPWAKKTVFSAFTLLVFVFTHFLVKDHMLILHSVNVYAYTIILFPLPFLLLGISRIRKRKADAK